MIFNHNITYVILLVFNPILLEAQLRFSEVALEVGIDHHYLGPVEMGGGAAFFDMDNDGDQDLWIAGGLNHDVLYENNGLGSFQEISKAAGLGAADQIVTTGVITGDLDNDGYKDVLLLTQEGFVDVLLRNVQGKFFEKVEGSGLEAYDTYSLSAAMADVNLDGLLDIYGAHYIERHQFIYDDDAHDVVGFDHQCYQNRLYINNGDWTFSEAADLYAASDAGCALAVAFSDYDADYDADLIIANDFGAWVTPNALYRNEYPLEKFSDVSESSNFNAGIYGMGIAIGDYDSDLDLDYYITNIGRNALYSNSGTGVFRDVAGEAGVEDIRVDGGLFTVGWGTAFMDFDNDRDLDLYVVNGFVPSASFLKNDQENPNRLFENDGSGVFSDITMLDDAGSPLRGRGLACADIDLDGDMDFVVINVTQSSSNQEIQKVQLYRNNLSNDHQWIKVKLSGVMSNGDGVGARVLVHSNGQAMLQEAHGGYGTHASQHSDVLHFGLGSAKIVDSLVVIWPGGQRQVHSRIAVNQLIKIVENGVVRSVERDLTLDKDMLRNVPNPFKGHTQFIYKINEPTSVTFQIFDELGRQIYQSSYSRDIGAYTLHWQSPGTGVYFVTMTTATAISNIKIIAT